MFTYKYCPKCKKRNNKQNQHCVRCSDQLIDNPKFGKSAFAIALSLVVLLTSAGAIAGGSYLKQRSANDEQPISHIEPEQKNVEPDAIQEPIEEAIVDEPVTKPKTTKEVVTEPQTTPPPVAMPVCDEGQKSLITSKFKVSYNESLSDMKSKMGPDSTEEEEDKAAMDEHLLNVEYYYNQYLQDMKNANCTAESLVGGLIPSY